jgi:hypothetical protein
MACGEASPLKAPMGTHLLSPLSAWLLAEDAEAPSLAVAAAFLAAAQCFRSAGAELWLVEAFFGRPPCFVARAIARAVFPATTATAASGHTGAAGSSVVAEDGCGVAEGGCWGNRRSVPMGSPRGAQTAPVLHFPSAAASECGLVDAGPAAHSCWLLIAVRGEAAAAAVPPHVPEEAHGNNKMDDWGRNSAARNATCIAIHVYCQCTGTCTLSLAAAVDGRRCPLKIPSNFSPARGQQASSLSCTRHVCQLPSSCAVLDLVTLHHAHNLDGSVARGNRSCTVLQQPCACARPGRLLASSSATPEGLAAALAIAGEAPRRKLHHYKRQRHSQTAL